MSEQGVDPPIAWSDEDIEVFCEYCDGMDEDPDLGSFKNRDEALSIARGHYNHTGHMVKLSFDQVAWLGTNRIPVSAYRYV